MTTLLLYIASFVAVWIISGIIINNSQRIAEILKLEPFIVSFFLLGFMTTVPEFSIGINSIISDKPSIFVGNLLGGISLLFLFTIPILAILGKSIILNNEFKGKPLLLTLFVVSLPFILSIDGVITIVDSLVVVLLYVAMIASFTRKSPRPKESVSLRAEDRFLILKLILSLVVSILLIILVANFMVETTIRYANNLNIPAILISVFVISIGTNLPELIVGIRSIRLGNKTLAYGNYLGSATANSLLFGIFSIITIIRYQSSIILSTNLYSFIIVILGLFMFFLFQKSKDELSRKEGFLLLIMYVLFILLEITLVVST